MQRLCGFLDSFNRVVLTIAVAVLSLAALAAPLDGCGAALIPALAAVVSGVTEVAGWVDQIESGVNKLGVSDPRITDALARVRAAIEVVKRLANHEGADIHNGDFMAAIDEAQAAYQALADLVAPHGFSALPGTKRLAALPNGQTAIPTAATVRLTLEGAQ